MLVGSGPSAAGLQTCGRPAAVPGPIFEADRPFHPGSEEAVTRRIEVRDGKIANAEYQAPFELLVAFERTRDTEILWR